MSLGKKNLHLNAIYQQLKLLVKAFSTSLNGAIVEMTINFFICSIWSLYYIETRVKVSVTYLRNSLQKPSSSL